MENFPQDVGKLMVGIGLFIATIGAGLWLMGSSKLSLFRLPGDLRWETEHSKIWFPLATCLVLSAILTLIIWLVNHFRH